MHLRNGATVPKDLGKVLKDLARVLKDLASVPKDVANIPKPPAVVPKDFDNSHQKAADVLRQPVLFSRLRGKERKGKPNLFNKYFNY